VKRKFEKRHDVNFKQAPGNRCDSKLPSGESMARRLHFIQTPHPVSVRPLLQPHSLFV
jgi:hypothetical protein